MATSTAARARELLLNYKATANHISSISPNRPIRLVLVSKLKPASDILALHQPKIEGLDDCAPEHFGENYIQELTEKANQLPRSIKWHFIGGLQSNKAKSLALIPNLWCVSSVDSQKKADLLEKGRASLDRATSLRVKVQVNTSGETSKSGIEPTEAPALCSHIVQSCPHLTFAGLMTIGAIATSRASALGGPNEDFDCLVKVREAVAESLGWDARDIELSMGMSGDYQAAIEAGSDEVRVGSLIFGERTPRRTQD